MKETKKFYKSVDRRSRKAMTDFLIDHHRYHTMNSWNGATSWSNNLKVYNVIPRQLQDRVFEMMECDDFYEPLNDLIEDYNRENNYRLQAGFNGRSGGYLVMYEGGYETKTIFTFNNPTNGRDYADGYGWMTIEEAKERGLYQRQTKKIFSKPGRSVDDYDESDYEEMSMENLRDVVARVQEFDKLCDAIVAETIYMAENGEVFEEEYTEIKTRKVFDVH